MPNEERGAGTRPDTGPGPGGEPLFQVVAGEPTHEELAALAAALSVKRAAAARQAARARPAPSAWAARSGLVRSPLQPGQDAWRRSYYPGR